MVSIHLIQFNENMKPKVVANHMNSQTYHFVTTWSSCKATAIVCRPNFPSFSSFNHDLGSQLSGLPKTISHSPFITFSWSDSSPISMIAAENPSRFNCSICSGSWSKSMVKQGLLSTFLHQLVRLSIRTSMRLPKPLGNDRKNVFPSGQIGQTQLLLI